MRGVNRQIARHADVMIGDEEDLTAALGFDVAGVDENLSSLDVDVDVDAFAAMIDRVGGGDSFASGLVLKLVGGGNARVDR